VSAKSCFTRREFICSAVVGTSIVYLPGIGRVRARPFAETDDHSGRLCYNENPLGPSPKALVAMQGASAMAHRYPDWYSSTLEGGIATHHGLQQGNVCAGTGATAVIRLIADAFLSAGDEMITATPTYFQMASEAAANGATVVHVPVDEDYVIDLEAISQAIGPSTKLISLVNPNNPLGTVINKTDMESFVTSLPSGIIVVVDEAYHHYVDSPDYESCIRFVQEGCAVIVVRTFSKAYGLAGARIGYSVAPSNYTAEISSSQMFGMVSNLSQAAATAALTDAQHVANTVALNDEAKGYLEDRLTDLGLDYIPSETNFMIFDTGTDASRVAMQLAESGYQVRTGWGMPQHIRVSTGLIPEMQGFIEALEDILGQAGAGGHETPTVFGLGSVRPNPFSSQCCIGIRTAGGERVALTVHDVLGRKVRSLVARPLPTGAHDIPWDGTDVEGRRVPPGVYVLNLIQGEFAASTRITLTR
jgi:histidinol-phosphate aminotransferase